MTDKTLKIIAVCKGWGHYTYPTPLETLVHFFADLYGYPVHFYTYKEVEKIMRRAFYDFIDHCDVPSNFLKQMYEWDFEPDYTLVQRIYGAFSVVPVYSGCVNPQFVNGFNEQFEKICEELENNND